VVEVRRGVPRLRRVARGAIASGKLLAVWVRVVVAGGTGIIQATESGSASTRGAMATRARCPSVLPNQCKSCCAVVEIADTRPPVCIVARSAVPRVEALTVGALSAVARGARCGGICEPRRTLARITVATRTRGLRVLTPKRKARVRMIEVGDVTPL